MIFFLLLSHQIFFLVVGLDSLNDAAVLVVLGAEQIALSTFIFEGLGSVNLGEKVGVAASLGAEYS